MNSFYKIVINLILFCGVVLTPILASAQIGIIWQEPDSSYYFLGAANMDNDPQDELVYFDPSADYTGHKRIIIRDGISGSVDWTSGLFDEIWIAGYNLQAYDAGGQNYGFSPFCDHDGDGKKAITFRGKRGTIDPIKVYVVGLGGTGIDDGGDAGAPPTLHTLSQNYPNPFNPNTTIEYQMTAAGHVCITIFNVLGQAVRTLVNEEKNAGDYSIVWDGRNDKGESVASGTYFYQLQAGNYTSTKKSLLLK